jgi:hypothetical protein
VAESLAALNGDPSGGERIRALAANHAARYQVAQPAGAR